MRILKSAVLVGIVLSTNASAWASDRDAFLGVLRRFGIAETTTTGKKPCLCAGGAYDGQVGLLLVNAISGPLTYVCALPSFNADGASAGGHGCTDGGGSMIVVGK